MHTVLSFQKGAVLRVRHTSFRKPCLQWSFWSCSLESCGRRIRGSPRPLRRPSSRQRKKTLEHILASVKQIDSKLDTLGQRVTALEQKGSAPDTSTNASGRLVPVTKSDPARIAKLEDQVQQLENELRELRQVQGQVARTFQDSKGNRLAVPNILANMERSPEFRAELGRAVHEVMQHWGTLLIENRTSTGQTIRVLPTGQYVYIPPWQSSGPIAVPVGTVSTALIGQEAPKNWVIGPPNYEQRIVINPRPVWIAPSPKYIFDPLWGWVLVQ